MSVSVMPHVLKGPEQFESLMETLRMKELGINKNTRRKEKWMRGDKEEERDG